ncbi:P-loop containing nucleoside triphosphate hydrolase protein, partial [Boletus edulis BED1]
DALRMCLIVFFVTRFAIVPRAFQLQASLATLKGLDSIITAGTGTGKTLCLFIPILLRPNSISITISPLKRLQVTQVSESENYGIRTVAINEDTPNDPGLWESIRRGDYQHLIISPEQLTLLNGHLPRLARFLRQDQSFRTKISWVHVDEAHNIYTAGLPHHGEAAFRPAYSKLGELRVLLSKGTPFQVLSATLPPHILSAIMRELMISPNHVTLQLSSNRPNITYATTPLIGSLRNYRNLNCLIPDDFQPPMDIPKTLVFHDSKQDATNAAMYTDSRLPKQLRNRGIVKHYHSDMSAEYLEQTYKDFSHPNGHCRILHVTAGASTGLDIRGVQIVIQYGTCQNMAEMIQRAGRAVRDPSMHGLFLVMFEPWALNVKLENEASISDDPDQPINRVVKKNSSKQERTGHAMIRYIKSATCLRKCFSKYLNDQNPSVTEFSVRWCCDRHVNSGFNLSTFFPG